MHLSASLKRSLCAISAAAICFSAASASYIGSGTVTGSSVNIRSGASTSSSVITQAKKGAVYNVIKEVNGWYEISVNGSTGFMSKTYMNFSPSTDPEVKLLVVTGSSVRLRKAPTTSAEIIDTVGIGTKLEFIDESEGWSHVKSSAYGECYIKSDYVKEYDPTESDTAADILDFAYSLLGTRYLYGGMSTNGFDCSGFVSYVFKNFGYSLHRVAADQYTYDGEAVTKENLQPGDLVFFRYGGNSIGHVGIYIGDGQFIHSSSSSSGGVIISDLTTGTYDNRYAGAKRLI